MPKTNHAAIAVALCALALPACPLDLDIEPVSYRETTAEADFAAAHAFFVDHASATTGRTLELDVVLDDAPQTEGCALLPENTAIEFPAYPEIEVNGGRGEGFSCRSPSLHMPRTSDFDADAGGTLSFEHHARAYAIGVEAALAERSLTPLPDQDITPGARIRFAKQGELGEVREARAYFVFTPTIDDSENTFSTIEDAGDEIVVTLPGSIPEMAAGLFVELDVKLEAGACAGFSTCTLEGVVSLHAMFDD